MPTQENRFVKTRRFFLWKIDNLQWTFDNYRNNGHAALKHVGSKNTPISETVGNGTQAVPYGFAGWWSRFTRAGWKDVFEGFLSCPLFIMESVAPSSTAFNDEVGSGANFTMQNHGDGPNTVPVVFADRPPKSRDLRLPVGGRGRPQPVIKP